MVRSITGTGEGNGPMISLHDGFTGPANWAGFLSGSDRVAIGMYPDSSHAVSEAEWLP